MYLGIHKHPREKINPTSTYLSNFLGCYKIFSLSAFYSLKRVITMYVCIFVYGLVLTVRIHIAGDAFDLSFFFTFLDRGKISRVFRAGAGVISSGFFPDGFPCVLPDRSKGVSKSSRIPRILVVPRERTALFLAVRVSNCLARKLMTLSCSADIFSKVKNIFLTFSNAAVFALALTTVTFAAGVFSMLSSAALPS